MVENIICLMVGLGVFCIMALVGEFLAKRYEWK